MVQFLYRDGYTYEGSWNSQDDPEELRSARGMDMRMYVLGDKYGIEALKMYANDRLHDDYVLDCSTEFRHHILAMIRYAYAHSRPDDERLRKALVTDMCLEGEKGEMRFLDAYDKDRWLEMAMEVPEFVADVMKVVAKRVRGSVEHE